MKPIIPWFEVPILPIPLPNGGTFELHGFGVLVAVGFMVGGWIAQRRATTRGDDAEAINRLIGWLVAGTFIGGHIGYGLMYKPDEYLKNPVEFLKFWQGLSSMGGFVVCVPLAVYFFYREKLSVWRYMDHLAHGMAIGWFFGRMGCFVAHDHPGSPTDFYLGAYGICHGQPSHAVACHDLGLYEAMWSLGMFILLMVLDRMRTWKDGVQVLLFGLSYGPVRFALDSLRPEATDPTYGPFTPGQYGAILVTLVCGALLVQRLRSADPELEPVAEQPAE